ncbi:hypothetical protein [Nostoc sp.]
MESPVTIYQTGSKQELHQVYVAGLKEKEETICPIIQNTSQD